MIGSRIEITGRLTVLSALQIGTGDARTHADIPGAEGDDAPLVAMVAEDCHGNPYLPGSGIKGVLRRFVGQPDALFGPATIASGTAAKSGRTIFRNAYFAAGPTKPMAGLDDRKAVDKTKGLIVEARIAKDPAAGVAGKGTLFHAQQVLPGTTFDLSLAVFDIDEIDKAELIDILRALAQPDGIGFGKHTKQGLGRLRLDASSVDVTFHGLGAPPVQLSDWALQIEKPAPARPATGPTHHLRLTSDVPFLIHDPLRTRQTNDHKTPHLQALMAYDGAAPRLTGSSLLGALRAGFAYYEADGRERRTVAAGTWFEATSATDRLFGDVGWKGRVEVASLVPKGTPKMQKIMSLKLDRFSGAPMDNALFGTEGWVGCNFDLHLALPLRAGLEPEEKALLAGDDTLFAAYLDGLTHDIWGGLYLGHGSNKGFGWFKVERLT